MFLSANVFSQHVLVNEVFMLILITEDIQFCELRKLQPQIICYGYLNPYKGK